MQLIQNIFSNLTKFSKTTVFHDMMSSNETRKNRPQLSSTVCLKMKANVFTKNECKLVFC